MTYKQKLKLFKDYMKIMRALNLINLTPVCIRESAFMAGFEACEKIYDKKLQKYLDKKGI